MFVNFATLLIHRLEQAVTFTNDIFMEAPRLRQFFEVLDTMPAVRDRPDALADTLARNVYGGKADPEHAARLAGHVRRFADSLAGTPTAELAAGNLPSPPLFAAAEETP